MSELPLGRGATQCQSLRWKLDYLIALDLPFRIDPWGPEPRDPIDPPRGFDFDLFEAVLLGAGVHRAREEFGRIEKPQSLLKDDGARLEAVFREGLSRGIEVFREEFNAGCGETARLLERLN
ncbi:hypothetical protein [Microlunatus ginsengisoli]|uniref:Uncharacterized protein n=1 Tax=Microlunatus ginsengisoli TaxID=363863 RepID=A0ABP7AZZ2_9ACTN